MFGFVRFGEGGVGFEPGIPAGHERLALAVPVEHAPEVHAGDADITGGDGDAGVLREQALAGDFGVGIHFCSVFRSVPGLALWSVSVTLTDR